MLNTLICSFKSELPNEIDFAMQVAVILANSDNFIWNKHYPLIDAICSSLPVYTCVCGHFTNCYCYPKFWRKLLGDNIENKHLQAATLFPSHLDLDTLEHHNAKDQKKIETRIETVAELIRQFSMTITTSGEKNINEYDLNEKKRRVKASPSLLKFMSLLLHCESKVYNLIALDIASNCAKTVAKVPEIMPNDASLPALVDMFYRFCVDAIDCLDGDVYIVKRSIEVVSKLISSSNRRVTNGIISLMQEKKIVSRIEQFLTCNHDVTLFLAALECCYRISRHQPHLMASSKANYLTKILMKLLNCDDRIYFSDHAMKRIKLANENERFERWPMKKSTSDNVQTKAVVEEPQVVEEKVEKETVATTKAAVAAAPEPAPAVATQEEPPKEPKKFEYTCEWDECKKSYEDPKLIYSHVYEVHVNSLEANEHHACLWRGPNGQGPGCNTKRPKYSLLTHLNDFHCSPTALERAQKNSQPIKIPEHPGYAPNAALVAIRRHTNSQNNANNNKSPKQTPISVSVRLTAALILRNLATQLPGMKHELSNYEHMLSEICMSHGRDESKIVAECLSLFMTQNKL